MKRWLRQMSARHRYTCSAARWAGVLPDNGSYRRLTGNLLIDPLALCCLKMLFYKFRGPSGEKRSVLRGSVSTKMNNMQ